MGDVDSVRVAGRIGCAIRLENKPRISGGDKGALTRKRISRKPLSHRCYCVDELGSGVSNTALQPSLRLALCFRMQIVTRSTFGISELQRRNASLEQRRCCSAVEAWLTLETVPTDIHTIKPKPN